MGLLERIGRAVTGAHLAPSPALSGEIWKARFDVLARGASPEQIQAAERVVDLAVELARRHPFTFHEAMRVVLSAISALQHYSDVDLEKLFGLEER